MANDYKLDIIRIQKKLKKKLSDSRYQHSLGVAYTAGALAMKYSEDINKAVIAGLLHDCAKFMTGEEMLEMSTKKFIDVSEAESIKPDLLHAKLGSYFAIKKYGIKDPDINSAIRFHTTGKPDMNLLEKIIYIADYIEPNRDKMPRLDIIRKIAFEDIDLCLKMILEDSVEYLKNSCMSIDETTFQTYEYYVNQKIDNEESKNLKSDIEDELTSKKIKNTNINVENKEKNFDERKNKRKRIRFGKNNRKCFR